MNSPDLISIIIYFRSSLIYITYTRSVWNEGYSALAVSKLMGNACLIHIKSKHPSFYPLFEMHKVVCTHSPYHTEQTV